MRRLTGVLVGIAFAALPLTASAQEAPDPKAEARAHLEQGQQFYEEEAFAAARAEFARAYELSKSYKVLYNLALVTAQLNDFANAYRDYARYLQEGGEEIPTVRRDEVTKSMEKLKRRTAIVELVADVKGAELTVDDKPIGQSPLAEAYLLNPGEHKLGATAPGHRPAYKHVSVTAGEAVRVPLTLPAEVERTVVVKQSAVTERQAPVWVYWVPAAVLAAGAATFGVLTLGAESDLEQMRSRPARADDAGALDDQSSRTKTFALVTDVLGAATIVAIGAGVFFTVRSARQERVGLTFGPGSLGVRGAF
jgi:hypothetical protein